MSGVTRSELTDTSRRELETQVEVQCQNWKTQQYIRLPPFVLNIQIQARSFWASAITNLSRAKRCHFSPLFIHTTQVIYDSGDKLVKIGRHHKSQVAKITKIAATVNNDHFLWQDSSRQLCDTCSKKNGGARGSLLLIHFFLL